MIAPAGLALVGAAAFAGGMVNAIAGGGSLITFPVLVAIGLPAVTASLTNTVAMCPGYLGATIAQRRDLAGQRGRAWRVLPGAAVGGIAGALLLLHTSDASFDVAVPYLTLLAAQEPLRRWLVGRSRTPHSETWAAVPVALAAIYGGYFGAGMGVMVLAALAVVLDDTLTRANALKQTVSLVVNVAAAIVFLGSGRIDWTIALVMMAGALIGGAVGGLVASRVPPAILRWTVVVVAVAVAIAYFVKP
jgi:uncharacterized protein